MNIPPILHAILDQARWAPSGDNTQPWRFEVVDASHLVVYFEDTRHDTVYDLQGRASQLSFGCLFETLAIAASTHGLQMDAVRRALPPSEDARPIYDVHLLPSAAAPDPLALVIEQRHVQRRPMSTRRLSAHEKRALEAAVGAAYRVEWHERLGERWAAARLMYRNAQLRLTMPEAFDVHRRIIEWDATRSAARVPDRALGVDALTLKLMKWAMVSWPRMRRVNMLMGTWAPRLQMDLLPGLACGAHLVIKALAEPTTIDGQVAAGRAVQRFWLTATALGLSMQPEMTPLIFAQYTDDGTRFTAHAPLYALARRLHAATRKLTGAGGGHPVFIARIGGGPAASAYSERKTVTQLLKP